ncbi:MAG TPA: hypothetical protein VM008_17365 [Phycisphaerae bacterium]|nr:hypothetical protein [Phycisphaerae bacterium]
MLTLRKSRGRKAEPPGRDKWEAIRAFKATFLEIPPEHRPSAILQILEVKEGLWERLRLLLSTHDIAYGDSVDPAIWSLLEVLIALPAGGVVAAELETLLRKDTRVSAAMIRPIVTNCDIVGRIGRGGVVRDGAGGAA